MMNFEIFLLIAIGIAGFLVQTKLQNVFKKY